METSCICCLTRGALRINPRNVANARAELPVSFACISRVVTVLGRVRPLHVQEKSSCWARDFQIPAAPAPPVYP